jgi:hypothetical protein
MAVTRAGSYSACIATVKSESSPSLALSLYAIRSLIAQDQIDEAAEWLSTLPEQDDASVRAVTLLNEQRGTGESVADELREILQTGQVESPQFAAVAGVILINEGEAAEALKVWHSGIQLHDQEW